MGEEKEEIESNKKINKKIGWLYNQFVQLNKKWFIVNPVSKYKLLYKYIQEAHNEST